MAASPANPPNIRKRSRKRRKRRNVSSSSSSSSEISDSSDSENVNDKEPSTVKIPQKRPAKKAVAASKQSSSSSESSTDTGSDSDSDSDSSTPFRKPPAASTVSDEGTAGPQIPPVSSTTTTTQKHTRAPSPAPLKNVPEPGILDGGDKAHEEALRARFRQFWLGSVADAFADDLNEIRKEPNLTPSRLSLLIDSLAAGADIYTSTSTSTSTNSSAKSNSNSTSNEKGKGKARINEMEIILGESE